MPFADVQLPVCSGSIQSLERQASGVTLGNRKWGRAVLIGVLLLGAFCFIQSFIPLRTAVQIGADEGFEVAKVTLCLHGHKLYSEVWNDQPPLHTWLVAQVAGWHSAAHRDHSGGAQNLGPREAIDKSLPPAILGPRLVTTVFTLALLTGVLVISSYMTGLWVGTLTTALLLLSPGFLELSSSCMLEIPALSLAVAGLGVLLVSRPTKWYFAEILTGVLLGTAALIKLVPIYLLPLAALILWQRQRGVFTRHSNRETGSPKATPHNSSPARLQSLRCLLISLCVLGVSLVGSFVLIDCLIERGAYLVHFQQSWASHFGSTQSFEHGSPSDYKFDWSILLKNWDLTLPALVGIYALAREGRRNVAMLLPVAWLALSLLVFTNHKPWWSYYYIHLAIPLCWCAAVGIRAAYVSAVQIIADKKRTKSGRKGQWKFWHTVRIGLPLTIFLLSALSWMGARLWLQVVNIRKAPQLHAALVLKEIERLKPFARWMYADQLVYSYHANIPMPPTLAVVPLKRLWAGDMTKARIAAEMSRYKPEIILLNNRAGEVPFQDLLETDYRLIYEDGRQQLYAARETLRKADEAERSGGHAP